MLFFLCLKHFSIPFCCKEKYFILCTMFSLLTPTVIVLLADSVLAYTVSIVLRSGTANMDMLGYLCYAKSISFGDKILHHILAL